MSDALLVLEDGTHLRGRGFGATGTAFGEAVFNTSLTGYQEVLTDPSYRRQIVTMTAPTLEMKTSYLKRLMPGPASVTARILKLGKSAAFMEADCFDARGDLVARATATAIPMLYKKL